MFYFRINKLKIVDNRENRQILSIFGADLAEVKLNSFISTDQTRLPEMDELLITNDPSRRKDLFSSVVKRVVDFSRFTGSGGSLSGLRRARTCCWA